MYRLFAIPVLFLAAAVHADEQLVPINATQRTALGIVTVPLSADAAAVAVGLPATVTVPPDRERVVAAPAAGMVSRVLVALGDSVKAGQAVVTLHGADLAAAQRDTAEAAVQARLAEASAQRDEALFEEGIVAESRVQAARAALVQARAHLAERRASLRLMGFPASEIAAAEKGEGLSGSVTLVAPIAGTVLEVQAVTGGRIEAASPLVRIANLDTLWLEIQAPVDVAGRVAPGQKVITGGAAQAEGSVLVVGRSVSTAQTVVIRAQVSNPEGALRLHQQVTVRVAEAAGQRSWRVPVRALVRQDSQYWIFVEKPGGFAVTPVQVLSRTGQYATVEGALSGPEQVVEEGVVALKAAWQGMGGE